MSAPVLPELKGTYLLVLRVVEQARLRIGSLGEMDVQPGFYLYAGSAWGPGGLRARVGRHFAGQGAVRWHIDSLRRAAQPVEAWCALEQRREHEWARSLAAAAECRVAVARFGASDCRCPAHLFFIPHKPDPAWLMERLTAGGDSAGEIQVFSAFD